MACMKFTRSGIPIPLDYSGREVCLLFMKYGRCRFKNKCKKSHWTPPLPDEKYPSPPPLPPSPSPSFSISDTSTARQLFIRDISLEDEQSQNLPAFEENSTQYKPATYLQVGIHDRTPRDCGWTNSQIDVHGIHQTLNQERQEFSHLTRHREVTQHLMHHPQTGGIQYRNGPALTATNVTRLPASTSVVNMKADVALNTENEIQGLGSMDAKSTDINSNVTVQTTDTAMDRILQVICKRTWRFDFVYHPDRQAKEAGWKCKSSIDQSYKQYGAYYNHVTKKLGFHLQPWNKVEKKNLKLLRKAHWNTCQELNARLAQLPPGYSLKVDFTRVNFNRLRPYFYLLVHQCFFYADPLDKPWKPTPFSCLVAETLIAFFTTGNISPSEAEQRMQDWGGRPVRVRQCVSHMWNIMVKSSLSTSGVAQEVLKCEQQVFAKKLSAMDYAYACSLAGPFIKGNTIHAPIKSTPTITKSVRQGILAAKKVSLSQVKRKQLNLLRIGGNVSLRENDKTIEAGPRVLGNGMLNTKSKNWKKKRKTRQSQQFSLLDDQGKQDLLKRCKIILA